MVLRATPLLITNLGQAPSTIEDFAPLLARREAVYALTKRISGSNRQKELKPHADANRKFCYSLEPGSRYLAWSEAGGGSVVGGRGAAAGGGGWMPKASAPAAAGPPRMQFHVDVATRLR